MKKGFSILCMLIVLHACSDGDENPSVERISDDYQPNTIGSSWSYSSAAFDYTYSVTNKAKKFSGKTYFEIKAIIGDGTPFSIYMRKDGVNYYTRETSEGHTDGGEYLVLKDATEGTTWTYLTHDTGANNVPIETTHTRKILETGGTYVVNDITYSDVIVVEAASRSEGNPEPTILYKYYAKGVGPIKIEYAAGFTGTELLEHSIKP